MSLKIRLALWTAGLLMGAVILFSAALLWSERRALREDQDRRLAQAVGGLADVCRGAVVGKQDLVLTNHLRRLGEHPEVAEGLCLDETGRILGHTDLARVQSLEPGFSALPAVSETPSFAPTSRGREGRALITVEGRPRGLAKILFDNNILQQHLESSMEKARGRIVRVSIAVILIGFLGSFFVTRFALASLGTLIAGVRTIAKGQWDHRIPVPDAAEIALLSREFNAMAGRLAELDQMKSDFVNSVTHDLKSPLTAIKASLEALQTGAVRPEEVSVNHLAIRENADRLMNLITSILEVARIESGLSLDRRPVRLEDIADRVVRTFRPLAKSKDLEIELLVRKELPPLAGDESKLERVIANLAGNAVKFTAKGRVTVEVDGDEQGQVVRVTDTGPGIPPEAAGKLFTKFYRAGRPGEKVEGTGLGLAIAKGIAEAHGGTLIHRNREGGGSLFEFTLSGKET